MSLVLIFVTASLLLGVLLGPLVVALLIAAVSDDRGRELGDWAFGLGLQSVWRPALTFNAANELTLKRRSYDEKHDEQKITFGGMLSGVERFLYDPQNRLHNFFGTPFGFVDERFGIILDPRDAIVGKLLAEAQEAGTYTRRVERGEQLVESVQGVFELPGNNVGVRLPDVWPLVGGSFDAQLVRKIREFYQKGQAPKASTTALRQLLVPVGTFIAIVLLGIFAAGQSAGGGGAPAPSGNTSEISIGWLMLLAIPALGDYDRRDLGAYAAFGIVGLVVAAGLYFVFPVWVPLFGIALPLGVWCAIAIVVGMVVIPFTAAWFGRSLGPFGLLFGKLFITIGLLAYDRPVINLADESTYELVEYDDTEWEIEPEFYRFALTRIGIGLSNTDGVWGDVSVSPEVVRFFATKEIEESNGPLADGGVAAPQKFTPTDQIKQENIYAYVPRENEIDDDATYVRTDRTTGWFFEAGQNRRLMKAALETAKEKFGGGQKPVSDKYVLGFTFAAMVLGALFDYLVFFS